MIIKIYIKLTHYKIQIYKQIKANNILLIFIIIIVILKIIITHKIIKIKVFY
jgi:hypothetical protein